MYVVMNRLSCAAVYAEHLERSFRQAGNMQGVPGFVSFMFLRLDEPDAERRRFVAMTTWDSRQSFEAWHKSEAFAGVHGHAEPGPIESTVEHYEVLG